MSDNNNSSYSFGLDLLAHSGCVGIFIVGFVLYAAFWLIVHVVLPGMAILLVLALIVLALGALWGFLCSLKNFIVAMKHNITFKGEGAK